VWTVIHLPINGVVALALLLLFALALLGSLYLYKLATQHKCKCPLCDGVYTIEERIGSGGYGSVYTVTRPPNNDSSSGSGGRPERFVLKRIPVTDINDATEAQREAKDLRYLRHPRIVRYVDDFLHAVPASLPGHVRFGLVVHAANLSLPADALPRTASRCRVADTLAARQVQPQCTQLPMRQTPH
jgi:hypothetical protein